MLHPLLGKNIIIAVSAGIAAYKINYLVRDLVKIKANVRVILTPDAKEFVSPLTLSTLSKKTVLSELTDKNGSWNNHVELALWADYILVAPCTANTLSKMASGRCDNLVIATYLSAKCPVLIAPAMDLDMYAHPSTLKNIQTLKQYGNHIIDAEFGELASGLEGKGRMAEPASIIEHLEKLARERQKKSPLKGKKIIITAGPTYEAIDPVRFLGNHSSGKMGFAIAQKAAERGLDVILISGPSNLSAEHPNIKTIPVTSAKQMHQAVFSYFDQSDIAIMSAAVADYSPKEISEKKIKKNEEEITLTLVKNPDILNEMGEKKTKQFLVGFALETNNEEQNAKAKLKNKNLDAIVLNSLRQNGAGFGTDTNKISIFAKNDTVTEFEMKPKEDVAGDILDFIEQNFAQIEQYNT